MTKPEPGQPVLINVGDRVLELKYPLRVVKELDREHGISILRTGIGEALQNPEKLAAMLYAGLKTKHPDVTIDWVDDNIDATMLIELATPMFYAISGRWPNIPGADSNPNPTPPATRSTGSQYGPSDVTTSGLVSVNSGN